MVPRVLVALGLAGTLAFGCDGSSPNNGPGNTAGNSGSTSGSGGDAGMGGAISTSSSSSSGVAGSGGSGGAPGCISDSDCTEDESTPICNTLTGECVGCVPFGNVCAAGQYCDPVTLQCENGCLEDSDCTDAANPICDPTIHACVQCASDLDCPQGQICGSNTCFPGCSGQQPCAAGQSCCASSCYDLSNDVNNCGQCNKLCPDIPNASKTCVAGVCKMAQCNAAYADCDKDPSNGCEWNVLADGACKCTPGATKACYLGNPGTEFVGPCKPGSQTCNALGTAWSDCTGQVLPKAEICSNNVDEDCNGVIDDSDDSDGDGFTRCGGDCCDSKVQGCSNPNGVNPGAFEFVGNMVDDDCDPTTSDTVPQADCSTASKFSGVTAMDVAKAIELCQTTTENPPAAQKKWGLIKAELLLANGSVPSSTQLANMQDKQVAILSDYGTAGIVPKKGPTMAGLSSGLMRDKNDPGYTGTSTSHSSSSTPPAAYLTANGGSLPTSLSCSGSTCPTGSGANDSANVRLTIRVPTNAQSLTYQFKFVSSEYWSFTCTSYNDFYLALLQTGAMGIPADKNISFDEFNKPLSVNNGFFDVCTPKSCYTCPGGFTELAGTGMEDNTTGGATKWLFTDAPVKPGETMQIEFMIFDVSDTVLDSLVLLDNFKWNLATAQVGTHE